jgi:hypothetical protein
MGISGLFFGFCFSLKYRDRQTKRKRNSLSTWLQIFSKKKNKESEINMILLNHLFGYHKMNMEVVVDLK